MNYEIPSAAEEMFALADRLCSLREAKAQAEVQLKGLNSEIEQTDLVLSDWVAESETQNFTRAGMMFCLTTKTRASTAAGRKDELFARRREAGYGDLIYETINANSRSAFVKEQICENADAVPAWLGGFVNVLER